jgi:hypothetical protein
MCCRPFTSPGIFFLELGSIDDEVTAIKSLPSDVAISLNAGTDRVAADPISRTRNANTVFFGVWREEFPLHLLLDCFRGQFEVQFFQKNLLMVGRP